MEIPYKWSGGKRAEIKLFKKYYPADFKTYIEPFFGAGAVFFDLEFSNCVINDIHPESINFLIQLKKGHGKEIHDLMSQYGNTENDYYIVRDQFVPADKTEEAFRFYYLRKTCFRGMLRYNKSGKFNVPFGRYKTYNFEELLNKGYIELLQGTEITNKDYNEIFNQYNSEDNFMFLDPPYDSEFTDYGYCSFGKKEHEKLAERFKETKNKCLLVIAETPFIKDLYKDYIKGSYQKKYAFKIHSGRVGNEIDKNHLIIANY
jgi:DNA adenine methylase